ncbi:MAG: 23S rRNA (uracil(1939)-C(5))-methyltransferase RlmD [Oscillospiraceae bacterium]
MAILKENAIYRVTIDGYASDGAGVARIDGQVLFVKGGVRTELCDVLLEKVGKSACWGRVVKIISACPARQNPDCLHYSTCGGCQFRHMNYAEELEAKRIRVEEALHRLGGLTLDVSVIHGAKNIERYRNKVQFPVALGEGNDPRIGFFRAKSHTVVDVADCLLQPDSAGRIRAAVKVWMTKNNVPAYEERTGKGLVRHLFLRTNARGESLCCLVANGSSLPHEEELVAALKAAEPQLLGIILNENTRDTNVVLGRSFRTLWGQDFLEDTLKGLTFRLSVPSFYQVNRDQTEVLYGIAADFAALTGGETLLDLYCGIGTIGLTLAGKAKKVIGAEIIPQAVEDARENAARNGITNGEFLCGDASVVAAKLAEDGVKPHVITVDPPRKGLAPEVISAMAQMAPERIVYVSCDPATLARDLKLFAGQGYTAVKAEAVDLFPRTAHVETVTLLLKS